MRAKKKARWRRKGERANGILDDERDLLEDDGEDLNMHMETCSDCQVTLSGMKRSCPETYPMMPMSWLHDEYAAIVWGKPRR